MASLPPASPVAAATQSDDIPKFKIVIVGDGGVGKEERVERWIKNTEQQLLGKTTFLKRFSSAPEFEKKYIGKRRKERVKEKKEDADFLRVSF